MTKPQFRAEIRADGDQSAHGYHLLTCPKCRQKLVDVESINGMVSLRLKCRRCGTYIKADVIGVE